jgi:hypothetical protein
MRQMDVITLIGSYFAVHRSRACFTALTQVMSGRNLIGDEQ